MKPNITHVSEFEGGRWIPWAEWCAMPVPCPKGKRIHAWKLSDGTVWDAYGGLRPEYMWDKPIDGTGWAEAAFCDDVDPSQREMSHSENKRLCDIANAYKRHIVWWDSIGRFNRG